MNQPARNSRFLSAQISDRCDDTSQKLIHNTETGFVGIVKIFELDVPIFLILFWKFHVSLSNQLILRKCTYFAIRDVAKCIRYTIGVICKTVFVWCKKWLSYLINEFSPDFLFENWIGASLFVVGFSCLRKSFQRNSWKLRFFSFFQKNTL